MEDSEAPIVQDLPVFMPGNNRNWEQVDGRLTVFESGPAELSLRNPVHHEALIDQARRGILLQVSFDYRAPQDDMDKINKAFAQEYHDEDTLMKVAEAIRHTNLVSLNVISEIITGIQNAGILFRERK